MRDSLMRLKAQAQQSDIAHHYTLNKDGDTQDLHIWLCTLWETTIISHCILMIHCTLKKHENYRKHEHAFTNASLKTGCVSHDCYQLSDRHRQWGVNHCVDDSQDDKWSIQHFRVSAVSVNNDPINWQHYAPNLLFTHYNTTGAVIQHRQCCHITFVDIKPPMIAVPLLLNT